MVKCKVSIFLTLRVGLEGGGGVDDESAGIAGILDSSNKSSAFLLNQFLELVPEPEAIADEFDEVFPEDCIPDETTEEEAAVAVAVEDLVGGGGNLAVTTGGGANESPKGSEGVIRSIWDIPCWILFNSSSKSSKSAIASDAPSVLSLVFLLWLSLLLLASSDIVFILLESTIT